MRSAHNICSRANIRSGILLLSFNYGQSLTFDNCSFSGNLVKKFCPGYYWRWISNDLAFRQFDIFPALSVYWASDKRNVWTSCNKTKQNSENNRWLPTCDHFQGLLVLHTLPISHFNVDFSRACYCALRLCMTTNRLVHF